MLEDYVRQALRQARIVPSRARGQHFLIDDNVLSEVVRAAKLTGEEYVVEIGPGLGTLTRSLASRCHRLVAYELDDDIVSFLTSYVLPETRNVVLKDQAFNKYVFEPVLAEAQEAGRQLKVVTNLPYQISSAFLHTVVEYRTEIDLTVVMLQREVAQRVIARPGDPGYNSFSLYLQTFLKAEWIIDVPPQSFYPEPKVKSGVISIRALSEDEQPQPRDPELYLRLIETVFRQRRKQIHNSLSHAFGHLSAEQLEGALSSAGISPKDRPQDLSMADYVRLADELAQLS